VSRYTQSQTLGQIEQVTERIRRAELDPAMTQVVYFLEAKLTRLVKIGITGNLPARLAQIARQTGSPIELLLKLPGNKPLEQSLHDAFDDQRVVGEWFRREGNLASFIAQQRLQRGAA
jgi:hypothetical protein